MIVRLCMPIPSLLPAYIEFDFFSLRVEHYKTHTQIAMQLFIPTVNTKEIPMTYAILKQTLPSVLKSQCFNELNLSFCREVRTTEIGHLFEHVLLEYLCLQKMAIGCKSATFSGVTNWNWKKEKWGSFHIQVNAGYKDLPIFSPALQKTIALTETVLQSAPSVLQYQPQVSLPAPLASEGKIMV